MRPEIPRPIPQKVAICPTTPTLLETRLRDLSPSIQAQTFCNDLWISPSRVSDCQLFRSRSNDGLRNTTNRQFEQNHVGISA